MTWIKRKILNWLVKDYLGLMTSEDLLQKRNGKWYAGKEELTPEQARKIRETARAFYDSTMWRYLKNDMKYHAYKKGFVEAQTMADQDRGKTMYYLVEQLDKWLQDTALKQYNIGKAKYSSQKHWGAHNERLGVFC